MFWHRTEVGRVIFISAPLRGSDIARNPIGRLGSMLEAPSNLLGAGKDALKVATFEGDRGGEAHPQAPCGAMNSAVWGAPITITGSRTGARPR